jgi:hypothetical protein
MRPVMLSGLITSAVFWGCAGFLLRDWREALLNFATTLGLFVTFVTVVWLIPHRR